MPEEKYVTHIRVSSGEAWPVRDSRVTTIQDVLIQHDDNIAEMDGKVTTAEEKLLVMEDTVKSLGEQVAGYLPLSGGTLTGLLCLTENVHYGDTLPEPGSVGRVFFKKVTDE